MYDKYKNDYEKFCYFNTLVLNMPRHQFGTMNIKFAKDLAILLDEIKPDENRKLRIIDLYVLIHYFIQNSNPRISNFIYELFDFNLVKKQEIKKFYNTKAG